VFINIVLKIAMQLLLHEQIIEDYGHLDFIE